MQIALACGGRGAIATTLADLATFASRVGFDGAEMLRTIDAYRRDEQHDWQGIDPPRSGNFGAMSRPPFHALVVRPAITHTHGGLAIDARGRALTTAGKVIAGLLVAGADAGDVYGRGYAGGLALASAFGIEAARTARSSDVGKA